MIDTVVFDLSGVVCRMRHERRLAALAAASDVPAERLDAEVWQSGLDDDFDRGRYSAGEIFALFQRRFGYRGDYPAFRRAWVDGFAPDRDLLAVVDRIRPGVGRAILSDNGPVLLEALPELLPEVAGRFRPILFSCGMGALKPADEVFTAAVRHLDTSPDRLLFFDDLAENVAAARRAGWQASVYHDAAGAEARLAEAGLLTVPAGKGAS
ncbi:MULTISPECIES: HAD-IA family hydrolase [unclassified Micromonospora]|uniref:HAD-IA family hydrolase n=1 Tax=unclassified Micromonospora TaxID=2617518 RepID=UPI001052531B|nr:MULTISPECIES: HAD-IA family hydrolase [unclassified Micromonospora]TDB82241.1 HAD family phosphatase [Micromonospora sp. KC721]TDC42692.1 HAD family phosphatase [Micromonospora sp. KC213]